jgi:hypothetical protein
VSTATALDLDAISAQKESSDEEFIEAVKTLFAGYAEKADLLDSDGSIISKVLDQRIYDEVRTKHVVSIEDPDDRESQATSTTKDELVTVIFTAGPTLADAERNAVLRAVYAKAQNAIWNRTQSGKRGAVQKKLAADKLVLVKGQVIRTGNPIPDGLYVSTQREVLVRDYWGPRLAQLRKLSDAFKDDFEMMEERVPPEVADHVLAHIGAAFDAATAKLPLELGSGGTGKKALGK